MTRIRPRGFEACIRQIKRQLPGLIVCAYELGVSRGEREIGARDFDLFVLARYRVDIPHICQTIRRIARQKLHPARTSLTNAIQDAALGEDDYTNLHVLAIGRDELGPDYSPRSFRLRTVALLAGKDLPLYYFRQRARLLFGRRLPQRTPVRRRWHSRALQDRRFARWRARLSACLVPMAAALLIPLVRLSSNEFRVWCFKTIWYQSDLILTCLRVTANNRALALQDVAMDHDKIALATDYRHHPVDYYGSRIGLYALTWRFLVDNLRLLLRVRRYIFQPVAQPATTNPAAFTEALQRGARAAVPSASPLPQPAQPAATAPSTHDPPTTSSAE